MLFSEIAPWSQQASLKEISPSQSLIYQLEGFLHKLLIKGSGPVYLKDAVHTIRSSALKIQLFKFLLNKPAGQVP